MFSFDISTDHPKHMTRVHIDATYNNDDAHVFVEYLNICKLPDLSPKDMSCVLGLRPCPTLPMGCAAFEHERVYTNGMKTQHVAYHADTCHHDHGPWEKRSLCLSKPCKTTHNTDQLSFSSTPLFKHPGDYVLEIKAFAMDCSANSPFEDNSGVEHVYVHPLYTEKKPKALVHKRAFYDASLYDLNKTQVHHTVLKDTSFDNTLQHVIIGLGVSIPLCACVMFMFGR